MDDKKFDLISEEVKAMCREYVIDLNMTNAAKRSGFSDTLPKARYHFQKPEVKEYIKYLQDNAAKTAGITPIRNAKELAAIAYPKWDESGNEYYDSRPSERIKAIELINKMFGFNAPEKSTIDFTNKSELENMTDEELAALIEQKRKQRQALSE